MFVLEDRIHIQAPIERCFLLSTSIELVALTLKMKPVRGKTSGLIVAHDRLEWRGWKFGLPQRHETLITGYDAPRFFEDTMASGRFACFRHTHHFTAEGEGTLLEDAVHFALPFGAAGRMVGAAILVPHIRGLLRDRFALIRRIAESPTGEWRRYLPQA